MIKSKHTILAFIAILLLGSCLDTDRSKGNVSDHAINMHAVVDILPFEDVPQGLSNYIFREITKIHPSTRLLEQIPLPRSAYYAARNRYRADSIIHYLSAKTPPGHITLALTTKDISTANGKIDDWGVFGLSYYQGKACVASTFRLESKNRLEQVFKVAIHELGHTQGLDNCKADTCFMHEMDVKYKLNEKKGFCPKCKNFLIKEGWSL